MRSIYLVSALLIVPICCWCQLVVHHLQDNGEEASFDVFQQVIPKRLRDKHLGQVQGILGTVNSYDRPREVMNAFSLFQDIIPYRLRDQAAAIVDATKHTTPDKLFAKRYSTVEELVRELFGDVDYIQQFDLSRPFSYNYEDYDISENSEVIELREQLTKGLTRKLYEVYKDFKKVLDLVRDMTEDDFVALHDHIYGPHASDETLNYTAASFESDISASDLLDLVENQFSQDNLKSYSYVPFIDEDTDVSEVDVQGIKFLIKIPLVILKLILKVFWELIALKKLIKIVENKIALIIISLIEKTCRLILEIKKELSYKIGLVLYAVKSGVVFKKILRVFFLIVKKLRVLSWILKDLLYRYKWKLIFIVKKAEKSSLLIALYFKEEIYKKLGILTKEQRRYKDFIDADSDYNDYDDFDYFENFAHYVYQKPGSYSSDNEELDKIVNEKGTKDLDSKKYEYLGNETIQFEMKENYGFDGVKLNLRDYQKKFGKELSDGFE